MPEEPEIETDELDERIRGELEREGGSLLKAIALTTAMFAALAAIAALHAGSTVNEALVLKTEATRLQAEASDQWADYQAKGIKSAIQGASESAWLALGKRPPALFAQEQQRYTREQSEIEHVARKKGTRTRSKIERSRPPLERASSISQQCRAIPSRYRPWRGSCTHQDASCLGWFDLRRSCWCRTVGR